MTQVNVLKILEKEKDWLSIKEIAKRLKIGVGSVTKNLNSLHKQKLVHRTKFKSPVGCTWKIR